MSAPDPTGYVASCLLCSDWQIDAPPRARASLGVQGVLIAFAEAAHAHQVADHPDSFDKPLTYRGAPVKLGDGKPANGGLVGEPLPRWWDWITVRGTR